MGGSAQRREQGWRDESKEEQEGKSSRAEKEEEKDKEGQGAAGFGAGSRRACASQAPEAARERRGDRHEGRAFLVRGRGRAREGAVAGVLGGCKDEARSLHPDRPFQWRSA